MPELKDRLTPEDEMPVTLNDLNRFFAVVDGPCFFKSLAPNDHNWADPNGSNMAGLVIPRDYLLFFPFESIPLLNHAEKFDVHWYFNGEKHTKEANVRYYCEGNRQMRPEVHLTRVMHEPFEGIEDGSLFLICRHERHSFSAIVIDCKDDDLIELARDTLALGDSNWGVWGESVETITLDEEWEAAIKECAQELYKVGPGLPTTHQTCHASRELAFRFPPQMRSGVPGIHPQSRDVAASALEKVPGNFTRWISQTVEYAVYREIERLHYPEQFIRVLGSDDDGNHISWVTLSERMGQRLHAMVGVGKSVTAARRSRAGYSFENHIAALFDQHGFEYCRQAGNERVDFQVKKQFKVSAKTSLRERWKQVPEDAYFVTIDANISQEKVARLWERRITLVVPEEDASKRSQYRVPHVISFREMVDLFKS